MLSNYLHDQKDFPALLRILEEETGIQAGLIEKDYWIMHVLYGLKKQGFDFELKGGTSLSKGYKIINRFSEDIDIHIKPPADLKVEGNPAKSKPNQIQSRKDYYEWLAKNIKIDGIISIERDTTFDDTDQYRSGGIRLYYKSHTSVISGVKEGILLEAGFDTVTPNTKLAISSWAFDKALETASLKITDNRAIDIICYHAGYTFVEKLQTIATKFRQEQASGESKVNFMRQYYDVYCLLVDKDVLAFIGTEEYHAHKQKRFPKIDLAIPISENEAFLLTDKNLKETFEKRYVGTNALYYNGQPDFDDLLLRIKENITNL
ncbi:nucleotidyl transferase AbiEii/AbiGii toxin family protein [Pedobacter petrophilus]|uniref:Nucleotidyl transferase AbiEii/AbiGii toxin family protein n=1 Tax=Pedobacter petrophilus TaxID=1908241 RepID=A0A7K0FYQ0_9SPHI|nr:nucleotidyl transferase AbiEii/AbiGii toxin family protein [Pedobacter petrophilus]MRX76581.1 nucleotidyl transferase AbiEii/AbiGii toxin family protein [Pedobacter petrophilus]